MSIFLIKIDIFSNGSIWKTVSLSIVLDNHTESGPPANFSFNNDQDEDAVIGDSDFRTLTLIILAVWLAVVISRRNSEGSNE